MLRLPERGVGLEEVVCSKLGLCGESPTTAERTPRSLAPLERGPLLDGVSRRCGAASKRQQGVAPAPPSADLRASAMVASGRSLRYVCGLVKESIGGEICRAGLGQGYAPGVRA
jgi:hypothetical protein